MLITAFASDSSLNGTYWISSVSLWPSFLICCFSVTSPIQHLLSTMAAPLHQALLMSKMACSFFKPSDRCFHGSNAGFAAIPYRCVFRIQQQNPVTINGFTQSMCNHIDIWQASKFIALTRMSLFDLSIGIWNLGILQLFHCWSQRPKMSSNSNESHLSGFNSAEMGRWVWQRLTHPRTNQLTYKCQLTALMMPQPISKLKTQTASDSTLIASTVFMRLTAVWQ